MYPPWLRIRNKTLTSELQIRRLDWYLSKTWRENSDYESKEVAYIHKMTLDLDFLKEKNNPQIASYAAFFLTSLHTTNLPLLLKT